MFDFEYRIIRRFRSRGIRLSIGVSGVVRVTAPIMASKALIERILHEKSAWIQHSIATMKARSQDALVNTPSDYHLHKKTALVLVTARIRHYNEHYQFPVARIGVRRQTSRWGSCSRTGSLNFNYQVVRLPSELVDYVVVHELCHLEYFNHSADFWGLVAQTIPDYQELRSRLHAFAITTSDSV